MSVDVVFPALNEAEALKWVLPRMPAGYNPIVVDNGSTDDTAVVARALDALVVCESQRGFGAACWAGLHAASADTVAFCDADASLDPHDLPIVCDPVEHGKVDLMLGRRVPVSSSAWPLHARVANRALSLMVRRKAGVALHDLGPMRAAPRQQLLELELVDRRFGWPLEMVLRAASAGWRVEEVAVPYHPRTGRSKVTGTVRGTVRTIRDMRHALRTVP